MKGLLKAFMVILLFAAVYASVFLFVTRKGDYAYKDWIKSQFAENGSQDIYCKGCPEGTAFVDLLVKDKLNDKYAVDFNEKNGLLLNVGRECGLATYDKDGYTSLMLRHSCARYKGVNKNNTSCSIKLDLNTGIVRFWRQFRREKLAYCDRDGNVIGVTDDVKIKPDFFEAVERFYVHASGESLYFNVVYLKGGEVYANSYEHLYTEKYIALFITLYIIAVIMAFKYYIKTRKEKKESAKMIKRIQSGEIDNEPKE